MARIDLEQEIFEFLDYEIRHGIHKEAAEAIRARLAEAQPQADNSPSAAIAALQKEVQWLKEVVGQHQSFVGLHTKLGGNSAR